MWQNQLADAAGLTAVQVNRSLMALREDGTAFKNGVLRISDWRQLAEQGDFDPAYLQMNLTPDERIRFIP
jgi:hypothetical protein